MPNTINNAGLSLIKRFEGLVLNSYLCPAGVQTIGYGHTKTAKPGMRITQEQADKLLADDIAEFAVGVDRSVTVPLTENQRAALVAFAFNVGIGAFKQSTLLRLLNKRDYQGAADQLPRWNKSGGKVLAGLVKRRAAERALFLDLPQQLGLFDAATNDAMEKVLVDVVAPKLIELLVEWLKSLFAKS